MKKLANQASIHFVLHLQLSIYGSQSNCKSFEVQKKGNIDKISLRPNTRDWIHGPEVISQPNISNDAISIFQNNSRIHEQDWEAQLAHERVDNKLQCIDPILAIDVVVRFVCGTVTGTWVEEPFFNCK